MNHQPELIPAPSEQTIIVPAEQADAAVARVRALGGAVLGFRLVPTGIELRILLDERIVVEVLEGEG